MCIIPAHLLKPGPHTASLQIGIHSIRWIVNDSVRRNVSIESVDGVNGSYSDTRPGLIMPKLDWIIKREILSENI